jgi:sugar phosphate isomerase/epimerase
MWTQGILSLAYLTVNGADSLQHLAAAAATGYQAAGLRILPPRHLASAPAVVGDAPMIRAIRRLCADTGILLLDAEVASITPTSTRAEFEAMVGTAAELGFEFIQTVVEDPDKGRAADRLGELADLAATADMRVALEFMRFRELANLQQAAQLIDATGRDNIQVLIDALHLDRSGGSADDVSKLPSYRVAIVQLCDAPASGPALDGLAAEARSGRLFPGEGELPLSELLDALPDGVPLSIEAPNASHEALDYLERARRAIDATRSLLLQRARLATVDRATDKHRFR